MKFVYQLTALAALANSVVYAHDTTGDGKRDFQEMCATYGFQFEEHTVVTEDGYILTVWRIPGLVNEPAPTTPKPSVLLQHGILDSANAWVMNYEAVSPAFVTARGGYDVWLGNSRGNTYSLGHVNKMKDKEYWAFDWEQMGQYDIPAVLEHIVEVTSNQKISYVGHSQGTTQLFYGMSEYHDYYKTRLNLAVMLGPVTKIPNAQSDTLHLMADFYDEIVFEANLLNIYAVFQKNFLTSTALKLFCSPFAWMCEAAEYLLISHNIAADDKDRFEVYMDHEPNGSSLQSMLLYAQNMKRDRFQVWAPDFYHWDDLFEKKDTDLIPLGNIKEIPVAMFVAYDDTIADPIDANWTKNQIGDAVFHYQMIEGGHLTFLIGKDMTYYTKDVMDLLNQYNPVTPLFLQ